MSATEWVLVLVVISQIIMILTVLATLRVVAYHNEVLDTLTTEREQNLHAQQMVRGNSNNNED